MEPVSGKELENGSFLATSIRRRHIRKAILCQRGENANRDDATVHLKAVKWAAVPADGLDPKADTQYRQRRLVESFEFSEAAGFPAFPNSDGPTLYRW
jgi:hypothetical protein